MTSTQAAPTLGVTLKFLVDEPVRLVRRNLRAGYWPFALPLALIAGVHPVVQLALMQPMQAAPGALALGPVLSAYALMLVVFFIYSLASVAMVFLAADAVAGRPLSAGRAWRRALDPRVIGTQVLVWMLYVVGFVLCILPGIYAMLVLAAVCPVMAQERKFGFAAIGRSFRLMGHNPQRVFLLDPRVRVFMLFLAGALVLYACSFVVQLPLTVVMMFLMFRGISSGTAPDPQQLMGKIMWLQVPTAAATMLLQTFVFLYLAFGVVLLYADICRRKEGGDLLTAAEALEPAGGPHA